MGWWAISPGALPVPGVLGRSPPRAPPLRPVPCGFALCAAAAGGAPGRCRGLCCRVAQAAPLFVALRPRPPRSRPWPRRVASSPGIGEPGANARRTGPSLPWPRRVAASLHITAAAVAGTFPRLVPCLSAGEEAPTTAPTSGSPSRKGSASCASYLNASRVSAAMAQPTVTALAAARVPAVARGSPTDESQSLKGNGGRKLATGYAAGAASSRTLPVGARVSSAAGLVRHLQGAAAGRLASLTHVQRAPSGPTATGRCWGGGALGLAGASLGILRRARMPPHHFVFLARVSRLGQTRSPPPPRGRTRLGGDQHVNPPLPPPRGQGERQRDPRKGLRSPGKPSAPPRCPMTRAFDPFSAARGGARPGAQPRRPSRGTLWVPKWRTVKAGATMEKTRMRMGTMVKGAARPRRRSLQRPALSTGLGRRRWPWSGASRARGCPPIIPPCAQRATPGTQRRGRGEGPKSHLPPLSGSLGHRPGSTEPLRSAPSHCRHSPTTKRRTRNGSPPSTPSSTKIGPASRCGGNSWRQCRRKWGPRDTGPVLEPRRTTQPGRSTLRCAAQSHPPSPRSSSRSTRPRRPGLRSMASSPLYRTLRRSSSRPLRSRVPPRTLTSPIPRGPLTAGGR